MYELFFLPTVKNTPISLQRFCWHNITKAEKLQKPGKNGTREPKLFKRRRTLGELAYANGN